MAWQRRTDKSGKNHLSEKTTKMTPVGKEKISHKCAVDECDMSGANKFVCDKHWCSSEGCERLLSAISSDHCVEHTCRDADCSAEAQHRSSYCADHIECEVPDCQRHRTDSPGPCCKIHTECMHKNCNQGIERKGFCNEHRCKGDDCRQARGYKAWGDDLIPSEYCPLHMCQWEFSRRIERICLRANEGLSYCKDHRCARANCQRPKLFDQSTRLMPQESCCRLHTNRKSGSDSGYDDTFSHGKHSRPQSRDGGGTHGGHGADGAPQQRRNEEWQAEDIPEEVPERRRNEQWHADDNPEPRRNDQWHADNIPERTQCEERNAGGMPQQRPHAGWPADRSERRREEGWQGKGRQERRHNQRAYHEDAQNRRY